MMRPEASFWLPRLADPAGVDPVKIGDHRFRGDPRLLFQLADTHGVLPIVIRNCKAFDGISPDPSALDWANARLRGGMVRSMILRKQRAEIEQAFLAAGVPAMILKGEDFADHLYPNASMRQFTDLDLLLPHDDFDSVRNVLSGLGYVPTSTSWQRHSTQVYGEEAWKRDEPSVPYGCVELHWNLVNSPSLQRSVSIQWDDLVPAGPVDDLCGLCTPDWNARLLITAAHAAVGHNFDRLTLLCDILQAVRLGRSRWEMPRLKRQITSTGLARSLSMGLLLAGNIFPCDEIDAANGELQLPRPDIAMRLLIDRTVVLGKETPLRTLRRKLFRTRLKRAG